MTKKDRKVPHDVWKMIQIKEPDQCWPFKGRLTTKGYGQISISLYRQHAHRVVYRLTYGPFDESLVIDHPCRVRSCCNPLHLEAVTISENALRGETGHHMKIKNRQGMKHGQGANADGCPGK